MKKKQNKSIYLDYAATTPVDEKVLLGMRRFWSTEYGNPGSIHSLGVSANKALEEARKNIALPLGARSSEIFFTSGGTESNNLAIMGVANFFKRISNGKKLHIITSKIEHHSVLKPFKFLEKNGFDVTYLNTSPSGLVKPEDVKKAIKDNTVLVSLMYANNEIGTIQPIREISQKIKEKRGDRNYPIFHTDACQAPGALSLQVSNLGIDLMTIGGSKIYGPKGSGFLYIKNGTPVDPVFFGGGQEGGLRSGTQNVPEIVGLSIALRLIEDKRKKESDRLTILRDYFITSAKKIISNLELNGDAKQRLPNNVNFYFPGISGEQLVIELDAKGVMTSTGSACSSREEAPSHVLVSVYGKEARANSSVRFTFGRDTTKNDILKTVKILQNIVERLRKK
ncbi:MAG: cysteine desulfurase family protein [bacterium]